MEKKGVYRKGGAGHVRNVNLYRLYRERYKKWRITITALLAFTLVFSMAPIVGDGFQASLLTADTTEDFINNHPEEAKKSILLALNDFVLDCEKYKMTQCVEIGHTLTRDVVNAGKNLNKVLPALMDFEERFEGELAKNACRFDLRKAVSQVQSAQKALKDFTEKYGESYASPELLDNEKKLEEALAGLDKFVESCR